MKHPYLTSEGWGIETERPLAVGDVITAWDSDGYDAWSDTFVVLEADGVYARLINQKDIGRNNINIVRPSDAYRYIVDMRPALDLALGG